MQTPPFQASVSCSTSGDTRGWRRGLLMTLAVAILVCAPLAAQDADRFPPAPWPVELSEAFELYYAGEFLETQRVCLELAVRARDARLRREADALAALATMRLPGRASRLEGRTRLSQLAQEDDALQVRPECRLAYGIAQTADGATATALHHLNEAAKTFAEQGRTARLAETLVALAQAWARHGEWELPVPGMVIPSPQEPGDADRIRAERIRALRERVALLPDHERYLARIDLILAQQLADSEDTAAEGLALLETLAGRGEVTATTARACLQLAEHHEAAGRWTAAAGLYARVQAAGLGELSHRAERCLNAIRKPLLIVTVPDRAAPGERVVVDLQARNVSTVEIEVRRVDLADWLEQRQGRFAEAALPTSGALVAAWDLDTTATTKHDWWRSAVLEDSLEFAAPAGGVVVSAGATDDAGHTVTCKRLVLVGDLCAGVFVGTQRAAIWATRGCQPVLATGEAGPRARFWMHGSFVPTRPRFTDGVAVFSLPPEARLLRDKRWVCLVQLGQEVTLCRGRLPATGDQSRRPAVALVGGPPELRPGEQLHVFGLLLGGADRPRPPAIELELLDAYDRVLGTSSAAVSGAGTFSAQLPIGEEMAGSDLRVAARLDQQVLRSVFSPLRARVAPPGAAPLEVRCLLPLWLPTVSETVAGQVEAAYPGGTPAAGTYASVRCRAVRLPTTGPQGEAMYSHALSHRLWLDSEGQAAVLQPVAGFHLPEGPLAVGLWVDVVGWDQRRGRALTEALFGPSPVHLWLRCQPDTPRVAEPLHVTVGWFDPTGRAMGRRPSVAVHQDGVLLRSLRMLPEVEGLRSEAWRPTAPGPYELVATLPLNEGDPITVRETIRVAEREGGAQLGLTPIRYEARFEQRNGEPHVRVRLDGQMQSPMLALIEAGELLAAAQLPTLAGPGELLLPLPPGPRRADARLVLVALGAEGVEILGVADVCPPEAQGLALRLKGDVDGVVPGATVEVGVTCSRAGRPAPDVTLMARLVDASDSGGMQWLPGQARADLAQVPGGIQVTSSATTTTSTTAPETGSELIPETHQLPPPLAHTLFEGPTLWVDARTAEQGSATFTVPLPSRPGLYRLVVAAYAGDGAVVSETLDFDTRQSFQLAANLPEQLTVGDRCVASLTITNKGPAATRARVILDGGPGLHLEEMRMRDRETHPQSVRDSATLELSLAPLGAATLCARVEAVRPGVGTAAFVVEAEGRQQRATASYHIHAAPTAPTAEAVSAQAIVVRRAIFALQGDEAAGGVTSTGASVPHSAQREWLRFEVEPGERILPGQLLLVQEEFSLARTLAQVEWRQRLPGNCYTHAGDWSEFRRIGTRREPQLSVLTEWATRLEAGRRYIHEYVIVPVWPGACRFPSPAVRAAGEPVQVQVESGFGHVVVDWE